MIKWQKHKEFGTGVSPGPAGATWAVDNSVDNVDKWSLGVWSLVGQEPNNSVYLAPFTRVS